MADASAIPRVHPGGLVTVAFLKAKLDEGSDHLGIFMPLLMDVIAAFPSEAFSILDVQGALAEKHGLAMPAPTVETLLNRATRQKLLRREFGRYWRTPGFPKGRNITAEKAKIHEGQERFADALIKHAARRGLVLKTSEDALNVLFRFLEEEQVALLLGAPTGTNEATSTSPLQRAVVAEFLQDAIRGDHALKAVLDGILEGLVLYKAAFLPDLNVATRRFKDLKVYFDSDLVRQALGYEGTALRALLRDTLEVLKAEGVRCLVFDKTVAEIRSVLSAYEHRMATSYGRKSLRPGLMARHFLTNAYSPSDIRQMAALLEQEIKAAGFTINDTPRRIPEYTSLESALAARLADPATRDELAPRVLHDVDCIAAILTLRRNHQSATLEEAGAVFASSSPLVIRNARLWWVEDERGAGIEPMVNIRALSNLAWLKAPKLCAEFKEQELITLCAAALRPSQATWQSFIRHLDALERSGAITSDEVAMILVASLSDQLLREAENDENTETDASTLDEIVDRVKASYVDKYEVELQKVAGDAEAKTSQAVALAESATERERQRELAVGRRAEDLARYIIEVPYWIFVAAVVVGGLVLAFEHPFHSGYFGIFAGICVILIVILEVRGIIGHLAVLRHELRMRLSSRIRNWLRGGSEPDFR